MSILKTEKLTKRFDGFTALERINLTVNHNQSRGLIGPNGAGKTTLINLIGGNLKPTAGRIFFNGIRIEGLKPHQISQKGIARTFQIPNLFWELSAMENIIGVTQLYHPRQPIVAAREILDRIGLDDKINLKAGELSHGDQRLLEIGIALAGDPKLLLLDEPTSGLTEEGTEQMIGLIKEIETAMIIIEHDINVVNEISDRITVLHRGKILFEGNPEEVSENEQVRSVYLRV